MLDFSRIEAGRIQARTSRSIWPLSPRNSPAISARRAKRPACDSSWIARRSSGGEVYVDRDMWEKIVLNL